MKIIKLIIILILISVSSFSQKKIDKYIIGANFGTLINNKTNKNDITTITHSIINAFYAEIKLSRLLKHSYYFNIGIGFYKYDKKIKVATQTYIDSIQLSNGDEYTYLKNFNNNINGTFYFGVSKKIDFKKFYLQSEIDLSANYFISKYEESYTQYYYFNGFRYLDVIERNGIKKVNSISSNLLNFLPKYRFCLLAGKQINSKTSLTACFTYENTPKLFKGTGGNFSIVSNPNSFSRKELEISNYHQFLIFTIGMNYKF